MALVDSRDSSFSSAVQLENPCRTGKTPVLDTGQQFKSIEKNRGVLSSTGGFVPSGTVKTLWTALFANVQMPFRTAFLSVQFGTAETVPSIKE